MSRIITFSRNFPKGHPKAGKSTYFVEKIWKSLELLNQFDANQWVNKYPVLMDLCMNPDILNPEPKKHTIRAGHRWKAGDKFSPRVWSGKPYQSKQIIIAPDIEIARVGNFEKDGAIIRIDGAMHCFSDFCGHESILAQNDGLSPEDMQDWFKIDCFEGQIIIWDDRNLPY